MSPNFPAIIPHIEGSAGARITLDTISSIVELPLVEACTILYKKGIPTVTSSANHTNANDFEKGAVIIGIDFYSLSDENKSIALSLHNKLPISYHLSQSHDPVVGGGVFYINIPATTPEEAHSHSIQVANLFKVQRPEHLAFDKTVFLQQKQWGTKMHHRGGKYFFTQEDLDTYFSYPSRGTKENVAYLLQPKPIIQ